VRKPRVAGLRKPAETSDESSAPAPAEARKPRPRPAPQPIPRPGRFPEAEGFENSAEDTAVFSAVDVEEPASVDALTGEAPTPAKRAPRRKVRDAGEAKPEDVEEAEAKQVNDGAVYDPKSTSASPYMLAIALVVVGLLLFGASAYFLIQKIDVSDATSNSALLDVAATAQVKDQVSKATEALFSYDYNNIKKTEDAANDLLVNDDVKAKYTSLMGEVKRLAPAQKMVVTCKVTRAAVIRLNGDLADVMVFVDQTSTRADTKKTTAGSAQLHLNAQLQGDKWKITDMNTYPAGNPATPAPASSPAPSSPTPTK
jgi:Mce-associated membrane protein